MNSKQFISETDVMDLLDSLPDDFFLHTNWKSDLEQRLLSLKSIPVVHCRDCNTYNRQGVAEGYGWCKKFCFGPPENYYCLWGAEEDG